MPTLFEALTASYKSAALPYPFLKPVTLAQWILESGRGTSKLATQHLNFAGLKWRSEMIGYAIPVEYESRDGLDFYCQFSSLEAFVIGYWKFLERSPYAGWEEYASESPEAFMNFIGPIYSPGGSAYSERVLRLLPEATARLETAPVIPLPGTPARLGSATVIVLDPGHGGLVSLGGSSANNAISPSGEKEKDWTLDIAKRTKAALFAQAVPAGKHLEVFLTRENDSNKGLSARANVAKQKKATLFLSIHFNGFNGKVRGVETFVHPVNVNKSEDLAFARHVQQELLQAMRLIDPQTNEIRHYDRKVKELKLGVLNDIALGNAIRRHPTKSCLVEIEFMDVPSVDCLFRLQPPFPVEAAATARNRQIVADALARAMLTYLQQVQVA